jgi:hypothetical protein
MWSYREKWKEGKRQKRAEKSEREQLRDGETGLEGERDREFLWKGRGSPLPCLSLCFVCFGLKWFLKNNFGIFQCLVGAKIIVNWKMISIWQKMHSKFRKWFTLKTDAFDPILNDAVDLHVQAVHHHWNLAGVEIWKRSVIVAGFWPPSPKSGQPRFGQPEWLDSDFRTFGQDLAKMAWIRPFWPELVSSSYKIETCFIIL